MERDLAIIYQSELYRTKKIISKLNDIGLATGGYEDAVYDIEEACRNSNKEDLKKGIETPFLIDYLESNYSKAINSLKMLQSELSKYETYIRINSFTTLLKDIIKNNKITSERLEEIVPQLIDILNELKKNNTLIYSEEQNIVEDIYKIVYYLLKEEVKLRRSKLYDALVNDEVHSMYLDREISVELKLLDRNAPKNNDIFNRKNILDLNGIDSHYLDYELLSLLVSTTNEIKDIEDVKGLISLYQDINSKLYNYRMRIDIMSCIINGEKEMTKMNKNNNCIKSIGNVILGTAITTGLFGGAYIGAMDLAKAKSTIITTYDTRDNSETTTEPFYSTDYTDGVRVTKYEPYRKALEGYYRNTTDYLLKDVGDLSYEEIMKLDFDSLKIDKYTQEEFKDTLSYTNIYNDVYYNISKISVDENDFTHDKTTFWVYFTVFEFIAISIYLTINISPYVYDSIPVGLVKGIKDINAYSKLIKTKKKINDNITERNRIITEVKELLDKYDYELRKLFEYTDFICEHGNDKTSTELREMLDSINKELALIEEKEQGTTIKDTVNKIKKRTR